MDIAIFRSVGRRFTGSSWPFSTGKVFGRVRMRYFQRFKNDTSLQCEVRRQRLAQPVPPTPLLHYSTTPVPPPSTVDPKIHAGLTELATFQIFDGQLELVLARLNLGGHVYAIGDEIIATVIAAEMGI